MASTTKTTASATKTMVTAMSFAVRFLWLIIVSFLSRRSHDGSSLLLQEEPTGRNLSEEWSLGRQKRYRQTFGDNACHPERSEGSGSTHAEILRCAQDDTQGY